MNTIVEHINSAGRIFVEFALPMLIQSSVLIVILLLVDLLLRKKVKAVFRYWIWMLVLLKLVLPTSLSSPLSLGYLFGEKLTYQDLAQTSPTLEPAVSAQADISPGMVPLFIQPNPYVPPKVPVTSVVEPVMAEPAGPPAAPVTLLSWQGVVFLVWLAVVIAMGLLLLQRALFVRGLVAQAKDAPRLMNDALTYCCASMGIKSKVGLKISVNATTPSVCGLIRPVILVPWKLTSTLGASRLRTILMHELAHIRRGDLWVNLAQTALQIIYFYNPLLWLANCVIRRIREQAVDEAVLVAMGEKAQKYPQTLVDVAKMAFKRPALSLRLIGVVESESALAGRIKHILGRPMPKSAKLGIIGLLVVIIAGAVLLPMARAREAAFAGQGGPLNIMLAGVRPDGSDDIYDDGGNKIAENTFANIAKEWGEDEQYRTFIFELPVTEEPILFSPFLKIKPTGAKRGFGTGQHPLLYYSAGKLMYSVAVDFPRTYKKVIERRFKKVDLTLRYYYGQRGAADFVFSGPFTPGQTVKAEGGTDCELTPKEDLLNFGSHPAAFFRISSQTRFDGDSVLIYDTSGRRYLLPIAGGGSGRGGTHYNYRAEGLTLNSIAYVTVGEKPYEAAFKNVVVSYPDRPVSERLEFLDEMYKRLDLNGFSGDLLNNYQFENPADAVKVIDIVRGYRYVMKVFRAIRYSDSGIELSNLDSQAQQKVRSAAAKWAKAGHPKVREMGIRLGLVGGWPEFMDMALDWLEQDVIVYDMLGRAYRGLEEGAKEQIAVEVAIYPIALNSEQADRLKKIILSTDSPRLGMRLFPIFWRADEDLVFQTCWDLVQDDRPWICWPAMYSLSNRCNEKLRPFENLPENIQKRKILVHKAKGGSSRLFDVSSSGKDYETVAKEAYSMLPAMFTARLARMNGNICHNVRQVMAKHLDREIATKAMTDFLREISTESNQRLWASDSPYFGTCCSTAYYIARHINSLYDVNIDNLGKYETRENSEAIPRHISQLKQLITKTLQWYDGSSGAGNESDIAAEVGMADKVEAQVVSLDHFVGKYALAGHPDTPFFEITKKGNVFIFSDLGGPKFEMDILLGGLEGRKFEMEKGRDNLKFGDNRRDRFRVRYKASENLYYLDRFGRRGMVQDGVVFELAHLIKISAEKPGGIFAATLPNGVTVELLGVCEHPSVGKQWWRLDGQPIAKPYERLNYAERSVESKLYEVVYRLFGSEDIRSHIYSNSTIIGHTSVNPLSQRTENLNIRDAANAYGAILYVKPDAQSIRLEIGAGRDCDWKTLCTQPSPVDKTGTTGPGVVFQPAIEKDGKTYVTIAHQIKDGQIHLIAVDHSGQIHKSEGFLNTTSNELGSCQVRFNLPADQIKEIQFQTQKFQRVTFKNVPLRPGHKTDVQVEVEEAATVSAESEVGPVPIVHAVQNKAMLPNGVTVELVGLCKEPVDGAKWWRPDGSYMPEPFFRAGKRTPPLKGMITQYTFLAKAQGGEDVSIKMKIYEGFGWSTRVAEDGTALCYVKHPNDTKPYHEDAFSQGPIEVGVAQGQWIKGRGVSSSNIQSPRPYSIGSHDEIVIQPPRPEKNSPETATIFWFTSSSHDYEYRLVCTLKDGSVEECMKSFFQDTNKIEAGGLKNSTLETKAFNIDRPLEQIVNYELLYRKFDYARFNNVAFKPNVKTDVQVEVEEAEPVLVDVVEAAKAGVSLPIRKILSAKTDKGGSFEWETTIDPRVRFRHGWYTVVDGVVRHHVGAGGSRIPEEGRINLKLDVEVDDNMLNLKVQRVEDLVDGSGTAAVAGKTSVPAGTYLKHVNSIDSAVLTNKHLTLWQGDFIRDGKVVKSVMYAAYLTTPDERETGFKPPVLQKAEIVTAKAGPDVRQGIEETVSLKLMMLLGAINSCTAETDLNIESVSVTARNIKIKGDTSNRANTLKFFDAINKSELEVLQFNFVARDNRDKFSIAVEPKKNWRQWWRQRKTDVQLGFEENISPKLVMLLVAIKIASAGMDLNIESISVSAKSMSIEGDTSGRTDTLKFLDAIKDNGLQVSRLSLDTKNNRGRFSITAEPKENWRQWWQKHKVDIEAEEETPDEKAGLVWGEAVEGVQVRLRPVKDTWEAGEKPIFKADIRNRGGLELSVSTADESCQLEIDRLWYRWSGPFGLLKAERSLLGPGSQINDISISLAKKWVGPRKALTLTAGMHTVRVAFILQRPESKYQDLVRAISNPIEIKILPTEKKPDVPVEVEKTISPKLVMLLGAINSCAAETELNIESISITARNIEIKGDTSGRTNTRKFIDAIKKNEQEVLQIILDAKGNREKFSIIVEPKKNWQQWWRLHKTDVQLGFEETVSPKLIMLLVAIKSVAVETDLNIESISVTAKSMSIEGDTSGRTNTRKFLDTIEKNELKISRLSLLDAKGNRDRFSIVVEPKENWRQWWQKHKTAVPYVIKSDSTVQAVPFKAFEFKLVEKLLDLVKQVEKEYPKQATHWPAGAGLYHIDAQGRVTVWHYRSLWQRSTDCAPDEVGWGSSQLINAVGMYYLPDGTPLQSRWRERGGGMKDIRIRVGWEVGENEHVPVIHRHRLPDGHDLLSRDGLERNILLDSWKDLPLAIIVRVDRPMRLEGWWLGDVKTDSQHFNEYDQLIVKGPPGSNNKPMLVTVVLPETDVPVEARISESKAKKYEGKTIDEWITQWDSRVSDDIDAATNALIRIGRPAVPAMIEEIKRRSNHGWRAVGVLSKMGPEAEDVLELLIETALDKDLRFGDGRQSPTAYRGSVLYSLSNMTWARQRAITILQKIAEDGAEDTGVRQSAIWALTNVPKEAMPVLQKLTEAEERSVRDAAHGAIGQLLEKEKDLSKDDYYTPLIEKNPFDPSVLQYLGNTRGIVNYGRPHPLTQRIKKLYRERLAKEPDAQLAWRLATIIQNGLKNTELMWAAPTDGSKGRSPREDPTENYDTLAEVLQLGFDNAESGSQLQRQFGTSLAKLRLLQGDWNRMNAVLQKLGQEPIPKESRQWLHAPPVDWEEDLRSQWKIADESMRSGNCSLEFKIEKAGKGLKGVHILVKRAPEPTNVTYTGISTDTLFFAPVPMKVTFGSFGYKAEDRPMTRYAVSDETGIVRFDKLPYIPVKIEVLVPTSNFPEDVSNWDLWMEVEPGKFKIAKKYGAGAINTQVPPAVVELKEGQTVHYPNLVVRPAFSLNVKDWDRVDKDSFTLSWQGLAPSIQTQNTEYELEMYLSAPGSPHYQATNAPVVRSAKQLTKDTQWPVSAQGVGNLHIEPGNIYMFEVRAIDASGTIIARWPRTRVWVPWAYRQSNPPFTENDTYANSPVHHGLWHRGSFGYGDGRKETLREKVARFLRDYPDAFEYEYARMGKAWLDWGDGDREGARQQLESLARELPKGNVARGTALWLIQQIDENKDPPKRLNFVPDRETSRSKAVSLPDEKTKLEQGSSEYGSGGILVLSAGKRTMYSSIKEAVDAAPPGSVIRVDAGVYGERPELEVEQSIEASEATNAALTVPEAAKTRGGISGVVVNSDTGEPIVGAYVGVGDFGDSGGSNYSRHRSEGFHDKTKTDEKGRFELGGLVFTDKHRDLEYHPLVVTHPDFVRHDEKIELLSEGPVPEVKVSLRPAAKIDVIIVDGEDNPLEGQWLLRLEALDGRRFIPPGSDPHLSSFASNIWAHWPDMRTNMGVSNGFTFTELDSGRYLIEAIRIRLVDKPTPGNIWKPTITYHGSIPSLKIEAGRSKQVRLTPQDHQTRLTITAPEFPDKLFDKLERSSQMPLMCLISRSPGALLWDDGKIRHLEDQRFGRIDKKRFFRGYFSQSQPLIINNLPPGSYSLFTMAVYGQVAGYVIGARADLAKGDNITLEIPWRQPTGPSMFGPNRSFDYPVKLEAREYNVSQLCEILTDITQSNPRVIADSSIENEKLNFGGGDMSVWDLLEKLYLDNGWTVEEAPEKTLILKPEAGSAAEERRVYLPDLETPRANVILDLATGEMLQAMWLKDNGVARLGKGDIVYEYAGGKGSLLCLRGAKMHLRTNEGLSLLEPDIRREYFAGYLLKEVPCQYQVTTAEGDKYELKVISIDKGDTGGAFIRFWKSEKKKPDVPVEEEDAYDKAQIENIIDQLWIAIEANDIEQVTQLGPVGTFASHNFNVTKWIREQAEEKQRMKNEKSHDISKIAQVVIQQDEAVAVTKKDGRAFVYYFVRLPNKWTLYLMDFRYMTASWGPGKNFENWPRTELHNEASTEYLKAGELLHKGTDRSEMAKRFSSIGRRYSVTRRGRICCELGRLLAEMAAENRDFIEPENLQSLPTDKKINHYIFRLRDVAEQEMFVPGKCRVLYYPKTPNSAAVALRGMGKTVIPAMIGLLDDRRPTRSVGLQMNNAVILRYCDAALEIIEAIAQQKFDRRTHRGAFLSTADDKTREQIVSDVKAWWEREKKTDVPVEGEGGGKSSNNQMQPLSFGPVVECVVHAIDAEKDSFIDFDTGKYFDTPNKRWLLFDFDVRNFSHRLEWAKKTGADATVKYSENSDLVMLWCYDVASKKVEPDNWQDLRAEQIVQDLSKATHFAENDLQLGHLRLKPPGATRIFKTREGGVGVIQIVGLTDNPKGVKIRYKMVQKEPAGKTNVQVGGLKGAS